MSAPLAPREAGLHSYLFRKISSMTNTMSLSMLSLPSASGHWFVQSAVALARVAASHCPPANAHQALLVSGRPCERKETGLLTMESLQTPFQKNNRAPHSIYLFKNPPVAT